MATWNSNGTDAGRLHFEATGRRVICVTDGVVGYWREMLPGETVDAALDEFRAGYVDATGDPVASYAVWQ